MIIDRDLLPKYCSGINLTTGSILAYYSFSEVVPRQNHKVFNSLYTTGDNFASGEALNLSKYAGVSMGLRNNPVSGLIVGAGRNLITGSGYFDGTDIIQIGTGVGVDSWTAFFNYSGQSHSLGKEKVLLSSCGTPLGTSGFSLGIFDNGFAALKQYNADGRSSVQLAQKYAGQNILSLSRDNDTEVSVLGIHNIYEEKHKYQLLSDNKYAKSDQWYIGHHNGVDNYDKALIHQATGFKGYIDDFVLFSGAMTSVEKEGFSKFFSLTGYEPARTGITSGFYSGVTAAETVEGVVGTELSGYRYEMVVETDRAGNTIESLKQVEVYKDILGDIINYTTGLQFVALTGVVSGEVLSDLPNQKERFGFDSIVFEKGSGTSTIVEYYNHNSNVENVNLDASVENLTAASGAGFSVSTEGIGDSFNVYVSGLYKSPNAKNIVPSSASFSSYTNGSDGFQTGTYTFNNVMTGQSYTFDPVGLKTSSYRETAHPQSSVGIGLSGSVHGSDVINQTDPATVIPKVNNVIIFHKTPTSAADRFTEFPVNLTPIYPHDYKTLDSGRFHPVSGFDSDPNELVVDYTDGSEPVLYHNFNHHQDSATTTFDGSGYLNKDLYLDGVKLFSGSDFDKFGGKLRLKKTVPAVGNKRLFFVPRPNSSFSMASGSLNADLVTVNTSKKLLDEMVWRQGRREKKTFDYDTYSKGGSFAPNGEVSTVATTGVYHIFSGMGDTGFFNIRLTSVQDSEV
jgi:hypothetical protein